MPHPVGRAVFCRQQCQVGFASAQVLLPVMIYTAGPISGAHFNPMVTAVFVMARMQVSPHLVLPCHPNIASVPHHSPELSTRDVCVTATTRSVIKFSEACTVFHLACNPHHSLHGSKRAMQVFQVACRV